MTFTVATFNLFRGEALVRPLAADVIGWQEANDADARDRIRARKGSACFVAATDALAAIPISWRTDVFELVRGESRMTHAGRAGVSPARGIVYVILRHKATGLEVAFINTHFISGAWSALRPTTAWRRKQWAIHMQALEATVRTLAQTHPVVVTGDMNRHEWLRLPGLHHATTSGRAPYDQIHSTLPISAAKRGPKYGSDHYSWSAVLTVKEKPAVTTYPAPNPVYLGPAAHTSDGSNKPINRIVIHSTVSDCVPGGARKIAGYFRSQSSGGSAHYVVDPAEVVQVVYDGVVAQHAPPNTHSLGVEMCDRPSKINALRWAKANQKAMLARTARLTAELCLAYDVPPVFVGASGLKSGRRGVTTHAQVSLAFKRSTHWDPGMWPRLRFMRMVRAEIAQIKAGA